MDKQLQINNKDYLCDTISHWLTVLTV